MERAGGGLADAGRQPGPRWAASRSCAARATTAATGWWWPVCCASVGARSTCSCSPIRSEFRGDARTNMERLPGPPATRFDSAGSGRARRDRRRDPGHRVQPASPASRPRGRSRRSTTPAGGPPWWPATSPAASTASTGEVAGAAVRADATVTFHAAKPGLWIAPGKAHAGDVIVIDIGIPAGAPGWPEVGLIDPAVLDGMPRRGRESTKFAAGAVLVCGGSLGLTGAPCMASEAAMRAGAGYVTAFVPASLNLVFEQRLLEVMTVPLPDRRRRARPDGAQADPATGLRGPARWSWGRGWAGPTDTFELARTIARQVEIPLLLDADGLNAHAGRLEALAGAVGADRADAPCRRARPAAGTRQRRGRAPPAGLACARRRRGPRRSCVLKGDDTIVADPRRPRRGQPRRRGGAGHRRDRRRALGRDRRLPVRSRWIRSRRLCRRVRARARRAHRRAADRRRGRDRA